MWQHKQLSEHSTKQPTTKIEKCWGFGEGIWYPIFWTKKKGGWWSVSLQRCSYAADPKLTSSWPWQLPWSNLTGGQGHVTPAPPCLGRSGSVVFPATRKGSHSHHHMLHLLMSLCLNLWLYSFIPLVSRILALVSGELTLTGNLLIVALCQSNCEDFWCGWEWVNYSVVKLIPVSLSSAEEFKSVLSVLQ